MLVDGSCIHRDSAFASTREHNRIATRTGKRGRSSAGTRRSGRGTKRNSTRTRYLAGDENSFAHGKARESRTGRRAKKTRVCDMIICEYATQEGDRGQGAGWPLCATTATQSLRPPLYEGGREVCHPSNAARACAEQQRACTLWGYSASAGETQHSVRTEHSTSRCASMRSTTTYTRAATMRVRSRSSGQQGPGRIRRAK